jgi:hypothetical protein
LQKNFTKCNVLIYDDEDKQLANVKIWEHNSEENYIVIQDWPELHGVERCKLLILTAPAPYAYIGTIRKHGVDLNIKLYEEHIEENRGEVRYKTDLPGNIEYLIYDGKSYPLHTVIGVTIINISKSGMRILAKENTLSAGDRFNVHVQIGKNNKRLTGMVANSKNVTTEHTEYGCRFVSEEGELN